MQISAIGWENYLPTKVNIMKIEETAEIRKIYDKFCIFVQTFANIILNFSNFSVFQFMLNSQVMAKINIFLNE